MKYYSTKNRLLRVSLEEAVLNGIAADGGLFMPEQVNNLPPEWFSKPPSSLQQISFEVARQFIDDDIPEKDLQSIVERSINFELKLVEVGPLTWAMELFHGPTLAFKDFGARFLAALMEYYAKGQDREVVVLAATSGDTGSAVASGFYNRKGIRVIILYPSGKVSPLQEKQLTTLGGNITAWEVDGTFDDCQRLVKQMFLDAELKKKFFLTSANSINIGRLLPQTFYYFFAWSQLARYGAPVFSVPSGNFGNLTAGVIAKRMGMPVAKFVASTNTNDVVPVYLKGDAYSPRPSRATISNAMDVGDPSNFSRLLDMFGSSREHMTADIVGYSFTDTETRQAMKSVLTSSNYLMDPHGAVGYLGLMKFKSEFKTNAPGVFLETAHPAKFLEVVEPVIGKQLELPEALERLRDRQKRSTLVSGSFEEAKQLLLVTS
jgi:threonine synthase